MNLATFQTQGVNFLPVLFPVAVTNYPDKSNLGGEKGFIQLTIPGSQSLWRGQRSRNLEKQLVTPSREAASHTIKRSSWLHHQAQRQNAYMHT